MIKKQHTFTIDFKSEEDDTQYTGTFTCKKLSIMDFAKVNVKKSQLGGGLYCVRDEDGNATGKGLDETSEWTNHMLALIDVSLIQSPQWWNLDEIGDYGLVASIFKEVMDYQNSFRKRGNGTDTTGNGSNQSSQDNGKTQSSTAQSNDGPKKVVDKEILTALDA